MKNVGLNIVALVLAVLFWAFVRITQVGLNTQSLSLITVAVPIRFVNTAPELVVYDSSSDEVRVTLRGDSNLVASLREGMVRADVDLNGMSSGSQWPEVKVVAPGGCEVVSLDPKSINVKLSRQSTKAVPVVVKVTGRPAEGLSAGNPAINPAVVRVSGPDTLLTEVTQVIGRVILDGQSQPYSVEVSDLSPIDGRGLTVSTRQYRLRLYPASVTVTVPILSERDTVAVAVTLDRVRVIPREGWRYRLEVEPEYVTLRVPRDARPPASLQTHPAIFESPTRVDSRDVDLVVPDGVEVVGGSGSTVRVRVIPERMSTAPTPVEVNEPTATPSGTP